jgi:FHA domain/Protein of unknown function (DUF3662)
MVERITGEEIIDEILNNMREGIEPLRYSVLVPGLYHVYLHEKDFNRLEGVFPQIIKEAKQALDEYVEQQNLVNADKQTSLIANLKKRIPKGFFGQAQPKQGSKKYQEPVGGWQISFHRDLDNELLAGDICIESRLTLPATIEFGAGNQTKTIKTLRRNGVSRKTDESPIRKAIPTSPSQDLSLVTGTIAGHEGVENGVYAIIHYKDKGEEHAFSMMKNQIVVGRGGEGYWVDLPLDLDTKISREHFRLRRDEATGKFYLKDLSAFGTTINGQTVPNSTQMINGERRDVDVEVELPTRARIGLAGTFILDFEASR